MDQSIPGGRSISHHTLNNQLCQYLSIDNETGGEIAGIIQLSAEIVHMKLVSTGRKLTSDKAEDCRRGCTFNRYVQPGCAPEYWDHKSIDVHGILPTNPRFFVAWNGGTCDLKWLWKLTQAPNLQYSLPENVRYFIDPCCVIVKYKSCLLNKTKSKTQGHALGVMWSYINDGQCLANAHDSIRAPLEARAYP